MGNNLKQEAITYFKTKPVMIQCLRVIKQKYASFGELTGTIPKTKLTKVDGKPLLTYLGLAEWEFDKRKSISIKAFIAAYEDSRFEEIPFHEIVEGVLGEPLISNKELKAQEDMHHQVFLDTIHAIDNHFMNYFIEERKSPYFAWFLQNESACLASFQIVSQALKQLPENYTKLPVFAHQLTGNPHAFDSDTRTGQLLQFVLLQMLKANKDSVDGEVFLADEVEQEESLLSLIEQENDMYAQFYLIKDDIMNFVAVNGLRAFNHERSLPIWEAACDSRQTWNVPVRQLLDVERVAPARYKKVFLIENSGVFSILLDVFPDLPMICTNGQFRYAVWLLLERLETTAEIYYSGDFDPEGLLIADRLMTRYPNQVKLLKMDVEAYQKSAPIKPISEQRLKQLKKLKNKELKPLGEAILQQEVAGYQEGILEYLIKDIEEIILEG